MDSLGIDNAIVLGNTPVNERVDMLDFFFTYLLEPTGMGAKVDDSSTFYVYPVPATGFIRVVSPGGRGEIVDMTGRVIWKGEIGKNFEIDISGWKGGMYYVRVCGKVLKFLVV